jgi:hypothetical protein
MPHPTHRPTLIGLERRRTKRLAACGGDVCAALKALIVENEYLESESCE